MFIFQIADNLNLIASKWTLYYQDFTVEPKFHVMIRFWLRIIEVLMSELYSLSQVRLYKFSPTGAQAVYIC